LVTSSFVSVPSRVEETLSGAPEAAVLAVARAKADAVAGRRSGLIIAADTVVEHEGELLGKPPDRPAATWMLERLSDAEHRVLTGVVILSSPDGARCEAVEETRVRFRELEPWEIDRYLNSGGYRNAAGAYAIQDASASFVERIEGDYYNVVGLPVCRLTLMLRRMGWCV